MSNIDTRVTRDVLITTLPISTPDSIEEMMQRIGLKLDVSASAVELDGPIGKAAKMQEELFMQAVSECDESSFPSFTKRSYPCWVISLTNLTTYDELPEHEDVIDQLEELQADSTSPSCAYSFFISQNCTLGSAHLFFVSPEVKKPRIRQQKTGSMCETCGVM